MNNLFYGNATRYSVGKKLSIMYQGKKCYSAVSLKTKKNGIVEVDAMSGNVVRELLPCQFDDISWTIYDIALVSQKDANGNAKYGFVRKDGNMLGISQNRKTGEYECCLSSVKKEERPITDNSCAYSISENGIYYRVYNMTDEFNKWFGPIGDNKTK